MPDLIDNPFEDEAPESPLSSDALNAEQIAFIEANWKDMDLMEMTRHIFKNDNLKGTSKEGNLVRKYLVDKKYPYKTTAVVRKEVILTDEHKEFIAKYASSMKPYEIARVIFKDEKIQPASKEAITVQLHIKSISPTLLRKDDEFVDDDYSPIKTFKAILKKINELTFQNLEESQLNVKTRKSIEKAVEFANAPRFVGTMTNLKNVSERTIFESEYIRSIWDKPDLTTDEINLYISLVNEYVIQNRLHRIMSKLNSLLENVTDDPDGKVSISLSDAIKTKSDELHQSLGRQAGFVKDLSGRRADRQKLQTQRAKSLVSLVEAFKEEAERKNLIRITNLRKKKMTDELTRLENEDELNARIFGITREELEE